MIGSAATDGRTVVIADAGDTWAWSIGRELSVGARIGVGNLWKSGNSFGVWGEQGHGFG